MNSEEIIDSLEITGKLMELHNENQFKSRAYSNAAFRLSKMRYDFTGKTKEDIAAIEGVGKGIAERVFELMTVGTTTDLKSMLDRTPPGVIEMLGVKGLGPKKVRQLWQELNIESVGELLYACNENRLVTLKGFGEKTQEQVSKNIEFRLSNQHKFHYASLEAPAQKLLQELRSSLPGAQVGLVGEMARKSETIDKVEILVAGIPAGTELTAPSMPLPVSFIACTPAEFAYSSVELSATALHLEKAGFKNLAVKTFTSEEEVYKALNLQFIPAELREGLAEVELAGKNAIPYLIEVNDLKGTLHNHTTYSDGVNTLAEMARYCIDKGLTYFGVCDHSKSAFYANGLSAERVAEQQREIDKLNAGYKGFKILKGIESDILNDGSLDYPDDVLATFDFIVASVHSNLKMNEEKATARLIKAIEHPRTSILGHPTGRLLLARAGYPIDHKKVIDACAANNVHIELNAHPYRLDIDWRWIPYCLEKNVMISINPDAHHIHGIDDMYWGTCAARKGMLTKEHCLNALDLDGLLKKLKK